ncbi:MAG: MBL fold metallo-hydrolase [Candidatus Latescibacteria bacterium]|nr:MBL fold metallo-hydrolase [bacterium]MBD3424986.1 MBL fold metallo-hydrolase [Candidatus Latescibacterota bacterium]
MSWMLKDACHRFDFSAMTGGDLMELKFLGHAAFQLKLDNGKLLVFDPYEAGSYDGALKYSPIQGDFDIAVVSHGHADHYDSDIVSGIENVVESEGSFTFDGITVNTYPCYHDETEGEERGENLISIVEAGGRRIAHLGDLGHQISEDDLPGLKGVDVMMIPVGGYFTIDAATAGRIVDEFKPAVTVPMHFKTGKVEFPINPVSDFTSLRENVIEEGGSVLELNDRLFSGGRKTVLLEPAN